MIEEGRVEATGEVYCSVCDEEEDGHLICSSCGKMLERGDKLFCDDGFHYCSKKCWEKREVRDV